VTMHVLHVEQKRGDDGYSWNILQIHAR
jgi:hypothetical protein